MQWSGARAAEPVELEGRYCRLVPLAREHAPALLADVAADRTDRQWTYLIWQPAHTVAELETIIDGLLASPGFTPYAILDSHGTPRGTASLMRPDVAMGTIEIGSILYGVHLARTRAATEAIHLLIRQVIDKWGYRRCEWKCDSLNEPSRRAAARLGFTYEGTFRHAVVYKGRNRDTAWFSITDDEWPAIRARHEAWLDPANFDADGVQRAALGRV